MVKSPEHIHTYLISSLSIWNASASGVTLDEIISTIETYSKFDVPQNVIENITNIASQFGFERIGLADSPICGGDGNKEYLALFRYNEPKGEKI